MKKHTFNNHEEYSKLIKDYSLECKSLVFKFNPNHQVEIHQFEDGKKINLDLKSVEKIIERYDNDGSKFLQINFADNKKILVTKSLVGFKPFEIIGFDPKKIPKVVTTMDLNSVKEALNEIFTQEEDSSKAEVEILKLVYKSIMHGAIDVGFEMDHEKSTFYRFVVNSIAATA